MDAPPKVVPTGFIHPETHEELCYVLVPKSRINDLLAAIWNLPSEINEVDEIEEVDDDDDDDDATQIPREDEKEEKPAAENELAMDVINEVFYEEPAHIWIGSGHTVTCYEIGALRTPDFSKPVWKKDISPTNRPIHMQYSGDEIVVTCGLRMTVLDAPNGELKYAKNMIEAVQPRILSPRPRFRCQNALNKRRFSFPGSGFYIP